MSARGKVDRKKHISRSARANLLFPVSRVHRYLKGVCRGRRVGMGAPVFLSAVLEYLAAEVIELGGNAAIQNGRKIITPRHLLLAIANDTELSLLLKGVTISSGGVLPNIHQSLLAPLSKKKSKPKTKPVTAVPTPRARKPIHAVAVKVPKGKGGARKAQRPPSSKGFTILGEKILAGGQKLTVVQGDLSTIQCDAVVHPTNSSLSLSGQCGSALSIAGGTSLRSEVNRVSSGLNLPVSEAVISGGGSLPCKHVIHVHSPSWNSSSIGNAIRDLAVAVNKCLSLAEDNKLAAIAFPSIASGSNGYPKQTAAQTILESIRNYYTAFSGSVQQVYFVLYDMESIGVYTSELARLQL